MPSRKSKKPMLNFAAPITTVDTTIKLEEPVSAQLEKYRDFIERTNGVRPSTDDIINRVLERLFARDTAFRDFAGRGRSIKRSSDNE